MNDSRSTPALGLLIVTSGNPPPTVGQDNTPQTEIMLESQDAEMDDEGTGTVAVTIQFVVGLVIVVLNGITFRVIQKGGLRLFEGTRVLLGNLALADAVFGASLVLRFFVYMFPSTLWYGCSGIFIGFVSSGASSSTFILLLCVQNYVSIKHPFMLKRFFKFRLMLAVSVVCWLFWAFLGALMFGFRVENFRNGLCRLSDGHPDVVFGGFCVLLLQTVLFFLIQTMTIRYLLHEMRSISPLPDVLYHNAPSTSRSNRQQEEVEQGDQEEPRKHLNLPSVSNVRQQQVILRDPN